MSHKKIIQKEDIDNIYYNTRNNLQEASVLLNCSVTVLRKAIFSYGLKPKTNTWKLSEFKDSRYIQPKKEILSICELKKYYLDAPVNMSIAAKNAGCSVEFMRRSLKEHGITGKKRSWNSDRTRKIDILNDGEWMKKELETKSMYQIAKELDSTQGNVAYYAYKHGLVSLNVDLSKRIKEGIKKSQPNGRFGENASNWRGGLRRIGTNGAYIYEHSPDHPNATKEGYVMQHRLVMEKNLGRHLTKAEVVHHINGNKKDNRIENLELVADRGSHTREHFERSHITELERLEKEQLRNALREIDPNHPLLSK